MSVDVITFGCRLNAYESDAIRARAATDGVQDTVVVNTCAVTAEAVRQARQAIRRARRERPQARIVATGCAAQIDPASFAAMPQVDLVLGNDEKAAPGALLGSARVNVGDIFAAQLPSPARGGVGGGGLPATGSASTARARRREPPTPSPSPRGGGESRREDVAYLHP